MGRGANNAPSVLDVVLHHWPSLIYLPTVVVLIATFVGITGWWDRRDEARRGEARVSEKKVRTLRRLRWRRQDVCTCSWHSIGTEVGAEGG
ncbi:MAG: hypothetical protein QOK35_2689 [Pseudonocardiales bacterium]|nr:hypothetical protein [Pseudonocardiales bacterium]